MPCFGGCDSTLEPTVEPRAPSCREVVGRFASNALARVDLTPCDTGRHLGRVGIVDVTFSSDGEVVDASFVRAAGAAEAVGTCVLGRLRDVRIPAFPGDSIVVSHGFVPR